MNDHAKIDEYYPNKDGDSHRYPRLQDRGMAHSAGYKRRSRSGTFPSSYLREPGDCEVHSCPTPEPQPSNPHKCLRPEQRQSQEPLQALSKRQKLNHATKSQAEKSRAPVLPVADFLARCSTPNLEEIKLFARHGGPDLSNLRGYQESVSSIHGTMSSAQPRGRKRKRATTSKSKTTTNTTTSKTRAYDRTFQQHLIDSGVYPDRYRFLDGRRPLKPNNWTEINERLALPRASLSPSRFSDRKFDKFRQAEADALKEEQVTSSVISIIAGKIEDTRYSSAKIPFTNLDHLTNGTLVPGHPDLYYGARPEQLNLQIRNKLSSQIIPSTQDDLPILPNFFLEAKGPDGSIAVATRQANYDGALGARGIHALQSYGQDEPVYDNNAYTITSTYHGGTLKMYTVHLAQPAGPGSRPEYYMTQINTWGMTGNVETFRQGATAFRNARDWAKEQRDNAIRDANGRQVTYPGRKPTGSTTSSSSANRASPLVAATSPDANPTSRSQEFTATQNDAPFYLSESEGSETSTDELELELARHRNPPVERFSSPRQPHRREINTGVSSARQGRTARGTQAGKSKS